MTTSPNNGISVRGLRVLYSSEYRRVAWWRLILGSVLGDLSSYEDDWAILAVVDRNGTRGEVARRKFQNPASANAARNRFVERVADMSQAEYETADWQQLLDEV